MAITGSGTSTAPYVVHDYWELKAVRGVQYNGNTDGITYVRLDNDINCNDKAYGDDFEWETIDLETDTSHYVDLNLDGHAIKNVMVKHDKMLFDGSAYLRTKIHNGQIRNIFGNTASNMIRYNVLESLSISVNAGGFNSYTFNQCRFNKCATYIEAAKLNDYPLYFQSSDDEPWFKNSDFYFKITDANNKHIVNNGYSTSKVQVQSCRFRGEIHGKIYSGISDMAGCVIDVDCDENNSLINSYENDNVLYNSDKMYSPTSYNVIAATTAEMKNASTLTSKGFTVVNKAG